MAIQTYKLNYYKGKLSNENLERLLTITESYIDKNKNKFNSYFDDSEFKTDFSRSTIKKIPFFEVIDFHFKKFIDSKKINISNICIPNLWVNCYNKNEFQYFHTHISDGLTVEKPLYSGSIYLKCPKGSGEFIFCNPDGSNLTKIQPNQGEIILFPSFLPHGVSPNKTNKERISVSFNIHSESINHPWEVFKGYADKIVF